MKFEFVFYKYLFKPLILILDLFVPKNNMFYGFSVHHIKSNQFVENSRAIFEYVKRDPQIKKIIFCRENLFDFDLEDEINTEIVCLKSFKGIFLFLRCKVLFVTHSISMDYSIRFADGKFIVINLSLSNRVVINLWHGIPFKRLYALWNKSVKERLDRVIYRHYERKMYVGLISSSDFDSFAMATMFWPIKYEQVWITGIPRNDFLKKNENELPNYLKKELTQLKSIKASNKKLILYAPTYRQTFASDNISYYQFTNLEIKNLIEVLKNNNAILGVRLHYFRNSNNLSNIENYIDNEFIYDLGHKKFSEISSVIRESDLVISDYSSVFIDALYVNKPVICFAYDYHSYKNQQDGILYDLDTIFPGPIVYDFENLLYNLQNSLQLNIMNHKYQSSKNIFYKYTDSNNSKRVINSVKNFIDAK